VLMTVHNAGDYLRAAVESVVSQDSTDWELILIDNGSTDGAVDAVCDLDQRIRSKRLERNIGRTRALQMALLMATAEYVAVLDADDFAAPARLTTQRSILDRDLDTVLVGTCVNLIDENSSRIGTLCTKVGVLSADDIAERNQFINSSVMFRREAAIRIGGYDTNFEFAQDYDLFLRLATIGRCCNIIEPLTSLRIHGNSYSRKPASRLAMAYEEVSLVKRAAKLFDLSGRGKAMNRRRQAMVETQIAWLSLKSGHPRTSMGHAMRAIRRDPGMTWIPLLIWEHCSKRRATKSCRPADL
jgi:glycosyltransferase involved in cell wall biosynthesis